MLLLGNSQGTKKEGKKNNPPNSKRKQGQKMSAAPFTKVRKVCFTNKSNDFDNPVGERKIQITCFLNFSFGLRFPPCISVIFVIYAYIDINRTIAYLMVDLHSFNNELQNS